MQVAIFSGCSSHSTWSMFFCCRVSASSFRVVSSGASNKQNTEHRLNSPFRKHLLNEQKVWGKGLSS